MPALVTLESLLHAWSVWWRVEVNIGSDDARLLVWPRRLRRAG